MCIKQFLEIQKCVLWDSDKFLKTQVFMFRGTGRALSAILKEELPDQLCHLETLNKIEAHPLAVASLLNLCTFCNHSSYLYSSHSEIKKAGWPYYNRFNGLIKDK